MNANAEELINLGAGGTETIHERCQRAFMALAHIEREMRHIHDLARNERQFNSIDRSVPRVTREVLVLIEDRAGRACGRIVS